MLNLKGRKFILLYPVNQKSFVSKSVNIIYEKLIDIGVVISHPQALEQEVLTIGEMYYQYKKQEEI